MLATTSQPTFVVEPTNVRRQRKGRKAQGGDRRPSDEEGATPEPISQGSDGQEQHGRSDAGCGEDPADQQRPQAEVVQVERKEDEQQADGQGSEETR